MYETSVGQRAMHNAGNWGLTYWSPDINICGTQSTTGRSPCNCSTRCCAGRTKSCFTWGTLRRKPPVRFRNCSPKSNRTSSSPSKPPGSQLSSSRTHPMHAQASLRCPSIARSKDTEVRQSSMRKAGAVSSHCNSCGML